MHRNTKVATCTYCGTRAALVLSEDHHVLVCSSCGAPLSDLKSLRSEPETSGQQPDSGVNGYVRHHRDAGLSLKKSKPKKRKKKKSTFKRLISDVFDEIEDIFD